MMNLGLHRFMLMLKASGKARNSKEKLKNKQEIRIGETGELSELWKKTRELSLKFFQKIYSH